jgi:N-acetylneuraminate synthase
LVKFIAEVSSNHAQDLGRSLAFVDAAADCGFDAVKFQLFRVAELFAPEILAKSRSTESACLGIAGGASGADRPRCRERGVEFSCTPFYWKR